jgi:type I restriction enzyme S subunit
MTSSVALRQVARIRNGFAFSSEDFQETGAPVIRMSDLEHFFVNTKQAVRVDLRFLEDLPQFQIARGDLLIGMSGSVGKVAVYQSDEAALQNQRVGVFQVVDPERLDARYLKFFAQTLEPKLLEVGKGVAVKNVSAEDIESFPIPLPDLLEQKRIAAILERADQLRRLRRFGLEMAEAFPVAAFLRLFGDPHRNPMGWPLEPLGELCKRVTVGFVGTMVNEYVPNGIPLFRSLNVRRNSIDPTELKFVSEAFHRRILKSSLSPGDVVAVRTGKPGVSAVIPRKFAVANCADLIVMSCGTALRPRWLSETLNIMLGDADSIRGTTGAIQTHFNIERAREIAIPLPPLALQEVFVEVANKLETLLDVLRELLRQADHLFQTLLHQAFTSGL